MISLLYSPESLVTLYAGFPFFQTKKEKVRFFTNESDVLRSRGDVLVLIRWFEDSDTRPVSDHIAFLRAARDKYKKIVFFDTGDSAHCSALYLLPYLDAYWKKQLYGDRSLYLRPVYGNRAFAEFYHEWFGVQDDVPMSAPADANQLSKLKVAWNLGMGSYPVWNVRERFSEWTHRLFWPRAANWSFRRPRLLSAKNEKRPVCHAHFSSRGYRPTIAFQRDHYNGLLEGNPIALQGWVERSRYKKELTTAAAVLSPFGWGEVCYRDFEAIQYGAVLIKPEMSHLETWPEVYRNETTCFSVAWDGHDLLKVMDTVLSMKSVERSSVAEAAWEVWDSALNTVEERMFELLRSLE